MINKSINQTQHKPIRRVVLSDCDLNCSKAESPAEKFVVDFQLKGKESRQI